jgi:sugar-specific transcriptional regulator TrmB
MTKGDQVYSAPLKIVLDPRAKFSEADRHAEFDLAVKLSKLMGHMTYAVDAIEAVRDDASARAAKLAEKDPLRARLQQLSKDMENLRSKIVATKEGGAITGEERIREHIGNLYGDVNGYEGRPGDYQVARAESLTRELEDIVTDFRKRMDKDLAELNASLKKKKMEAISVLSEADWQKQHENGGSATQSTSREAFERD